MEIEAAQFGDHKVAQKQSEAFMQFSSVEIKSRTTGQY